MTDFELKIGAKVDEALRGVRQLEDKLKSLTKLSKEVTKALSGGQARVRIDTRQADQAIRRLQTQIRDLDNQTVRVRVQAPQQIAARGAQQAPAASQARGMGLADQVAIGFGAAGAREGGKALRDQLMAMKDLVGLTGELNKLDRERNLNLKAQGAARSAIEKARRAQIDQAGSDNNRAANAIKLRQNAEAYLETLKQQKRQLDDQRRTTAQLAKEERQRRTEAGKTTPASRTVQTGVSRGVLDSFVQLAGVYVGLDQTLRQLQLTIQATFERTGAEQRLRSLTNATGEYTAAISAATQIADRFNLSQTEAISQFSSLYARLRPIGLELDEIRDIYEGYATASRLAGVSTAEFNGSLTQLIQGIGSGKLSGDELRSVLEGAPLVAQALAKELGVTVGELKKLGSEGAITAPIVVRALQQIKRDGVDQLADSLDTPAQQLQKLNNNLEDLRVALGKLALPGLIQLVENAADQFERFAGEADRTGRYLEVIANSPAGQFFGFLAGQISNAADQLDRFTGILSFFRRNPVASFGGIFTLGAGLRELTLNLAARNDPLEARRQALEARGLSTDLSRYDLDAGPGPLIPKPLEERIPKPEDDKAAREAKNKAEETAREQLRLDQQRQEQQLRLDEAVYRAQVDRANAFFDLMERRLNKMDELTILDYPEGPQREQAQLLGDYVQSGRDMLNEVQNLSNSIRDLDAGIERLRTAPVPMQVMGAGGMVSEGGSTPGSGAYPITSRRGPRGGRYHAGTDYGAPIGTSISTTVGGMVTDVGYEGGYGNYVEVQLKNGVKAFWAHLSEVVLQEGMSFDAGTIIAKTGNTGRSTGPHLHSGDRNISEALSDPYTMLGGKVIGSGQGQLMTMPDQGAMISRQGDIGTMMAEKQGLVGQLEDLRNNYKALRDLDLDLFIKKSTNAFDDQTEAIMRNNKELNQRSYMQMEGFSESDIENAVRLVRINDELADRTSVIDAAEAAGTLTTERAAKARDALTEAAKRQARAVEEATDAELRSQVAGLFTGERENTFQLEAERNAIFGRGSSALKDEEQAKVRLLQLGVDLNSVEAQRVLTQARLNDGIREEIQKRQQVVDLVQGVGQTIESGLVRGIEAAVTGAEDLRQVLSDVLADIGKLFIQFAVRSALSGVQFNGIPLIPRAKGGDVQAGRPYRVGEEGEELFIPGVSGTIVPNDVFEATKQVLEDTPEADAIDETEDLDIGDTFRPTQDAVQVAADALSSPEQADDTASPFQASTAAVEASRAAILGQRGGFDQTRQGASAEDIQASASALFTQTSLYAEKTRSAMVANQQTLTEQRSVMERRSEEAKLEALIANPGELALKFDSTTINNIEYMTVEQGQRMATEAARRGRDQAIKALQTSVRARKQVGI